MHLIKKVVWLVVEPTHLKNLSRIGYIISPGFGGENKKCLKPLTDCILNNQLFHHHLCHQNHLPSLPNTDFPRALLQKRDVFGAIETQVDVVECHLPTFCHP